MLTQLGTAGSARDGFDGGRQVCRGRDCGWLCRRLAAAVGREWKIHRSWRGILPGRGNFQVLRLPTTARLLAAASLVNCHGTLAAYTVKLISVCIREDRLMA
jgi:hypothetical protein